MSEPVELTDAQRRHLRVLLGRLVEEAREQQERWTAEVPGGAGRPVRDELAELRRTAARVARELGVAERVGPPDPHRRLGAWSATWWSHVLDARPSALRRFGDLDQRTADRIGPLVEDLAERLRRLRALADVDMEGKRAP
ncbi:MAG: hypothetical protein PVF05_09850 [Gemmatimonadales bacterium]|jgi:hypothetical protein